MFAIIILIITFAHLNIKYIKGDFIIRNKLKVYMLVNHYPFRNYNF